MKIQSSPGRQELLELLDTWHQNMQKVGKCQPRPMFILSGGAIAADHRTTDYRQETSRKKSWRMESNSTCSFGELIPAKSDSPSSAGYSYESQDYYDTSSTAETLSTSFTADSMSTSSMGDMSLRLPPSPPVNFHHHLQYYPFPQEDQALQWIILRSRCRTS
ncbi:hypothetical protein NC652_000488 [Populus alba x Populus x berolinensis]|nr:hypothetical protein NC652_000488 [Populus alba x Populus x berolinensis]